MSHSIGESSGEELQAKTKLMFGDAAICWLCLMVQLCSDLIVLPSMVFVSCRNKCKLRGYAKLIFAVFWAVMTLQTCAAVMGFLVMDRADGECVLAPIVLLARNLVSCLNMIVYFIVAFRMLGIFGTIIQEHTRQDHSQGTMQQRNLPLMIARKQIFFLVAYFTFTILVVFSKYTM